MRPPLPCRSLSEHLTPSGKSALLGWHLVHRRACDHARRHPGAVSWRSCAAAFSSDVAAGRWCLPAEHRCAAATSVAGHDNHLCEGRLQGSERSGPTVAGGVAMMTPLLDEYLALRRAAGFQLRVQEAHLRNFVKFASERGEAFVRAETAVHWAVRRRLPVNAATASTSSYFARYAKLEDSSHEVPPLGVFSSRRLPSAHLFSRLTRFCDSDMRLPYHPRAFAPVDLLHVVLPAGGHRHADLGGIGSAS